MSAYLLAAAFLYRAKPKATRTGATGISTAMEPALSIESPRGLPPVERWNPPDCGSSRMRIARDGTWYHDGAPIARKEMVRLFSTLLRKDAEGYVLVTPHEKLSIAVEEAPFVAVALSVEGEGRDRRLCFVTNVGDETVAGAEHPLRVATNEATGEPAPYVHVRGGLEAKLQRAVFYQLADLAVAGEGGMLGVWSDGVFFPLGPAA